ncbi:large conductance mechanosensitive channel protein MscL [Sphingopyxis yananensis]|uniref:large conductance mechanosensitive channel protein MscL n=1 Tax=Sphingopyxis yananensis TaxID=2886687 RepID=UPI001D0FCBDB|nr:large conductance mechanosensitive channel protein MscL [Sphingopyxis yananensis]MCC2602053.1 large conductance mechanosensitive channel protein MscL [Sphingopyxis yananensis]
MLKDFKAFLNQGNVMGLAVGVIIGGAFGKIVSSLTDDVLMPFIGFVTGGGVDFSNQYLVLSGGDKVADGMTLAAAKAAGANIMALGSFVTAVINFVLLAFVVFLLVRQASKLIKPAEEAPAGPTEVEILAEIRDELRRK